MNREHVRTVAAHRGCMRQSAIGARAAQRPARPTSPIPTKRGNAFWTLSWRTGSGSSVRRGGVLRDPRRMRRLWQRARGLGGVREVPKLSLGNPSSRPSRGDRGGICVPAWPPSLLGLPLPGRAERLKREHLHPGRTMSSRFFEGSASVLTHEDPHFEVVVLPGVVDYPFAAELRSKKSHSLILAIPDLLEEPIRSPSGRHFRDDHQSRGTTMATTATAPTTDSRAPSRRSAR